MTDTPRFVDPSAQDIAACEQRWNAASELLDQTLAAALRDVPRIKAITGLSDASIIFDYAVSSLQHRRNLVGMLAAPTNEAIAAAALTRLVQQMRGEDRDMSQFEQQIGNEKQ